MWQDLVDQKDKWIGGRLIDYGDSVDRQLFAFPMETEIVRFELSETYFRVVGKDFNCGGTRDCLGLVGKGDFQCAENGLTLKGYGGHEFHIVMPDNATDAVSEDVPCQESGGKE